MAKIEIRFYQPEAHRRNVNMLLESLVRLRNEGYHAIRPIDLSVYSGLNYSMFSLTLYLNFLQDEGHVVRLMVRREGPRFTQELIMLTSVYDRYYEYSEEIPEKFIYEGEHHAESTLQ